jgi:hypothetical protein
VANDFICLTRILSRSQVSAVPLFLAKKEVFGWVKTGEKTIDVRKGEPWSGETATFLSGSSKLKFQIAKKESGRLTEIVTRQNYRLVIPSAKNLDDALSYFQGLYGSCDGVFTAYYLAHPDQ